MFHIDMSKPSAQERALLLGGSRDLRDCGVAPMRVRIHSKRISLWVFTRAKDVMVLIHSPKTQVFGDKPLPYFFFPYLLEIKIRSVLWEYIQKSLDLYRQPSDLCI